MESRPTPWRRSRLMLPMHPARWSEPPVSGERKLYAVWRGAVLFTRLASFRAVRFGDGWAGAIRVRFGRFLWIFCSPILFFCARARGRARFVSTGRRFESCLGSFPTSILSITSVGPWFLATPATWVGKCDGRVLRRGTHLFGALCDTCRLVYVPIHWSCISIAQVVSVSWSSVCERA